MDWPLTPPAGAPPIFVSNAEMWLEQMGAQPILTSAVWPDASDRIYCPVRIPRTMIVKKLYAFNGAAVSGNCDISLSPTTYDRVAGGKSLIRPHGSYLAQAGSTAQAGTNAWQTFNVTDVKIAAGLYWLGYSIDNITGQVIRLGAQLGYIAQFVAGSLWNAGSSLPMAVPSGATLASWLANGRLVPALALGGVA